MVKNLFASSNLSDAARRRVDLAVAMAEERLLNTHVEHALQLVDLAQDEIPFDDALDVYTRLLRLNAEESRIVTTQALARLGERTEDTDRWTKPASPAKDEEAGRRSFIENIRQRLRGRVNEELRRRIEMHAARAEVAILETHVENALHFVDILENEQHVNEAIELYLDALEVRDSIAEVVYYFALTRVSDEYIGPPKPGGERTISAEPTA